MDGSTTTGSDAMQADERAATRGLGQSIMSILAPSRGVQVWAVLKEIGRDGVRERVRRHNAYAKHLAARIEATLSLELVAPSRSPFVVFGTRRRHFGIAKTREALQS